MNSKVATHWLKDWYQEPIGSLRIYSIRSQLDEKNKEWNWYNLESLIEFWGKPSETIYYIRDFLALNKPSNSFKSHAFWVCRIKAYSYIV